jgi:cytochrome c oxidase cbb3-type subunit 2
LNNPRDLVPESNMPGYPWLERTPADDTYIERKLTVLRSLGHPYTDAEIAGAKAALAGKTEQDALIAYLQVLGTSLRNVK